MEDKLERLAETHKTLEQKMADKKQMKTRLDVLHAQTNTLKKAENGTLQTLWKDEEAPIADIAQALKMTAEEAYAFIYQMPWFLPRRQLKGQQ